MTDPASIRRLYGRRTGHKLRQGQAALVEELLPRLVVPDGPLSAQALFGDDRPLWLEIGFGRGEHLGAQAEANPTIGLIGCEPFLDGVVGALMEVRDRGLTNVRLLQRRCARRYRPAAGRVGRSRLPAASRSLAQGAPCQAPLRQPGADRPGGAYPQARRRVPAGHRPPDLLPLGDDADGQAARFPLACRNPGRLAGCAPMTGRRPVMRPRRGAWAMKSGTSASCRV